MRIRLSDEDRERLGCEEWIDVDLERLSVAEAEQIELAGGDFALFRGGRGPRPVQTRVWVGLFRLGIAPAKVADLEINLAALSAEESPGKAPSAPSDGSTSSTSAPSGRRTRSKR